MPPKNDTSDMSDSSSENESLNPGTQENPDNSQQKNHQNQNQNDEMSDSESEQPQRRMTRTRANNQKNNQDNDKEKNDENDNSDDDDDIVELSQQQLNQLIVNDSKDPFVGMIEEIRAENFMTYDNLYWTPSAGLNVIIGPNGTGKSSLSAAICIGLNGAASLTSRADGRDVSHFIKHGKNIMSTEITLKWSSNRSKKIRRVTTSTGQGCRNKWYIDNQEVNHKLVTEVCHQAGIYLDNLCQYLPQERVKKFAEQDSKQLLINCKK